MCSISLFAIAHHQTPSISVLKSEDVQKPEYVHLSSKVAFLATVPRVKVVFSAMNSEISYSLQCIADVRFLKWLWNPL